MDHQSQTDENIDLYGVKILVTAAIKNIPIVTIYI